jgi:hypothetical protein
MRAGPLSRTNVIETLNRYFVPVYTSNEEYRDNGDEHGSAPPEERAAYQKIYLAALKKKLSTGTVHAYVLTPDGDPIDSLHVADAATGDKLLDMLRRTVRKLGTKPGDTLVPPKEQSACPVNLDDKTLVLHLTARAEGTNPSDNSWHAYPSEDWIVLDEADQRALLPPAGRPAAEAGASWDIPRDVATKVLTHFYPQTENNDVGKNRIDRITLKATVVSVNEGVTRARLDGDLRMQHPFYHKETPDMVDAAVVGYIEFRPGQGRVKSFKLATDRATYMKRNFDVGVRSVAGPGPGPG